MLFGLLTEVAETDGKHGAARAMQAWLEDQLASDLIFSDNMCNLVEVLTCDKHDGFTMLYHTFKPMGYGSCLGDTTRRFGDTCTVKSYTERARMYMCETLMDELTVMCHIRADCYGERPIDELCEVVGEQEAARIRAACEHRAMPLCVSAALDSMSPSRCAWMQAVYSPGAGSQVHA
jgi:hypothetical protein